jgi:hypothetical protein
VEQQPLGKEMSVVVPGLTGAPMVVQVVVVVPALLVVLDQEPLVELVVPARRHP